MISPERWRLVEPILDAVLDLAPDEASSHLDRLCAGNPEIRDDVEGLLAALRDDAEGERFLDAPPSALTVQVLTGSDPASAPAEPKEGAQIGPYHVVRRLGRGGMGVVYLARDPRLARMVALKLLPPWLAADERATRRLVDEAKAASALDHPNIATVYDIGSTDDGRQYLAMAYYEGETLEDRIRRAPLGVDDAVAIAIQLTQGLEAAHARGIVHRDIKPANVMVTGHGSAKILDFGVAKAMDSDVTEPGATPGTVAYMSPEQTRGQAIDARTDLWSLGVVLYEMLAGRRPFVADGPDAVIYAIRHDDPEALRRLRPEVPEPVARVAHRCLAKNPQDRYRDAASLSKALRSAVAELASGTRAKRRIVLTAVGLTAAILGTSVVWPRIQADVALLGLGGEESVPLSRRVAVLPLTDSSASAEDAYFADGLTEELIGRLSVVGTLRTTAFTSVTPYKGTDKSLADIARELGVGALLLGDVRRVGDRVQLSVRLVDPDGREHWAEAYDTTLVASAMLEQDIVQRIVAALRVEMGEAERRRVAIRGTESADAYTEYLKGRYYIDRADTWAAKEHFDRALDLDPTFAGAWGGLARTYIQLSYRGLLATRDAIPRARQAAERALELNPDLAEAHAHLAAALNWYFWDRNGAEQHLRRAIELDPSAAWAYRALAVHYQNLGRFDEALTAAAKDRELDPLHSADSYLEEGLILYLARRYDDAMARYQHVLQLEPENTSIYFYMALVYVQLGQYDEALAALHTTDPADNRPNALALRAHVLGRSGQQDEARSALTRLEEVTKDQPGSSFQRAHVAVGLGEFDRALDLLEQAAEARPWQLNLLKVEPAFDPLRSEPRFQVLLRRMNLTD